MKHEIETLYDGRFISLKNIKAPELGINGYVFSHESRCDGKIVSILPYRLNEGRLEFLLRREITPCWGLDPETSSITGGCDKYGPIETAQAELKEEAGYESDEFVDLGQCYASKSSDSVYYLFGVDLTDKEQGEATGDGTPLDNDGTVFWSDYPCDYKDPLLSVMYSRLMRMIEDGRVEADVEWAAPDIKSGYLGDVDTERSI